ncbi:MAG: DNA translocase FtsK [Chitinophagaceae bacterium]|nr:DNA translocase FtsK [Chitinophagaceae bacterium]
MATKRKKTSKKSPKKKPNTGYPASLKADKTEKLKWKQIIRDERTWKIIGSFSIVAALFLLIAFISYFFTWKEDQNEVFHAGFSILFDNSVQVHNLLGRLGALSSHFFIYKCFGIASLLICTFFFVAGVNLLFSRKVFSVRRNLKYVTLGLLVLSVTLHFVLSGLGSFPYGGGVGKMVSDWMVGILGTIGTAAVLVILWLAYFIWQFNPAFNLPKMRKEPVLEIEEEALPEGDEKIMQEENTEVNPVAGGKTINDLYAGTDPGNQTPGLMKRGSGPEVSNRHDNSLPELKLIEKDELTPEEIDNMEAQQPTVEKEIVKEVLHQNDLNEEPELPIPGKGKRKNEEENEPGELELEIKTGADQNEKEKTYENLPPYEPTLDLRDYKYPTLGLLDTHGSEKIVQDANELENNKNQIIATLRNYDIEIQKISATVGPTVTLYEIVPAAGVRISRIKNLEDDIALSLAALGIRIIAPIPGKGTIGIEVPNVKKSLVSMRTLLSSEKFQHNNYSLPIALGKKIDNDNYIVDLTSMPHLLMAGATGQGKSVGINAILVSLLYKKHPSQLKFVLIDPKKVELNIYRHIEKHFLAKLPGEEEAIITDTKKVVYTLNALCIEMDNRYDLLKEAGARNIKEYNEKFIKRRLNPQKGHQYLPFIVLVIDEFADLIMSAGKEIELPIARLAQLARAVGLHLIIATQRPSVNIITGTIKANFPCRIAFKVTSKIDSRTILDTGGADQLIGKGDMLISFHGEITRLQCVFVDTPEVERVVEFIGEQRGYPQAFLLPEYVDEKELEGKEFDLSDRDPLFEDAARLIVSSGIGSTSLLQRRMKLGYNRAGRLMDQLEAAGIVGPSQGSKARDVLIKTEMDLQQHLGALG